MTAQPSQRQVPLRKSEVLVILREPALCVNTRVHPVNQTGDKKTAADKDRKDCGDKTPG